jgi:hypothetical protein
VSRDEQASWLPERLTTASGENRRVGVEIEFAGVEPGVIAGLIVELYGGSCVEKTRFEIDVIDTRFGDFKLELDSAYLKQLAAQEAAKLAPPSQLGSITADLLARASALLVPWEIVAPPIAFAEVQDLCELVARLRQRGALGTRHALQFAFGVHLNPELPDLEHGTIVNYLRAYFCLYDWIVAREKIDPMRKLTPYIDHFGKPYIRRVIDWNYRPSQQRLIINARPTFHYRLPNCDIDNPGWNLDYPWQLWLEVEKLSNDESRLREFCAAYRIVIDSLIPPLGRNSWLQQSAALLEG